MRGDVGKAGAGLTLLELVVVLSISATLCAVAVPGVVQARRTFRAADAAGRLALLLRTAQARAQAGGVPVRVQVDGAGHFRVSQTGSSPVHIAVGDLGAAVVSNYPDDTVEFGAGGLPTVAGGVSPRAGHFDVGAGAAARSVVVQLGGCVRCV